MLSIFRSDASLVAQILSGKTHLFDELVRRHFSMVYGIALSYTHRHADAEDLSQETFLKAYQSLDTLQDPAKFGHWINQITRNQSRNWYTRKQREAAVLQNAASEANRSTAATSSAYDDLPELLGEQIEALDPIPREVLLLHYFSQKSTAEIAKAMDVSQAAVLKRLQRAREALGTRLIHELKIMPQAPTTTGQHRKIIMSAVAASGLTWTLSDGTLGSILASTLFSAKGVATTVVVVSGVAATIILSPVYFESAQESRATGFPDFLSARPAPEEALQIAKIVELSQVPAEDLESPPPVESVEAEMEETASEVELTQAVAKDEEDMLPIEGEWNMFISQDGIENPEPVAVSNFTLEGTVLTIQGTEEPALLNFEGEVHGFSVLLEYTDENSQFDPAIRGYFSGNFAPEYDELTVSGTLILPGEESAPDQQRQLTLRFEKLSEHEKQAALAVEKASDRLETLRDALMEFISKEGGAPKRLSSLYHLLDDMELIEGNYVETIEYFEPTPILIQQLTSNDSENSGAIIATDAANWQAFLDTHDPGYLLAWEDELTGLWGNSFPGGNTLLRLKNSRYDFAMSIGIKGNVKTKKGSQVTNADSNANRMACSNNLRQMGLVFKMFSNECPGEYYPGGQRQVFPEYLSDLAILTCPGDDIGTLSYEIPFPAANNQYFKELYATVNNILIEEVPGRTYQSEIPIMIEKNGCGKRGSRNRAIKVEVQH